MAYLRLISLHCAPEDFFDGDEPYLVADRYRVVAGETKDPSGAPPIREPGVQPIRGY